MAGLEVGLHVAAVLLARVAGEKPPSDGSALVKRSAAVHAIRHGDRVHVG